VSVPVIGMGGIMSLGDMLEFLFAGASAIQVGTGIFADPSIPIRLIDGLEAWMADNGVKSLTDIIGVAQPSRSAPPLVSSAAG